jgi:hypothetical protein
MILPETKMGISTKGEEIKGQVEGRLKSKPWKNLK